MSDSGRLQSLVELEPKTVDEEGGVAFFHVAVISRSLSGHFITLVEKAELARDMTSVRYWLRFSSSPGLMDTYQCPHNAAGGVPWQRRSIDDTAQSTSVMH